MAIFLLCGGDMIVKIEIYKPLKNIGMSTRIMARRVYGQFTEVKEEYFHTHLEEIDTYLEEIFDEYAEDHNSASLLASLHIIAKVKGISHITEKTGMTRQGIQHALSSQGNPTFDSVNSIMNALGYHLVPKKLDSNNQAHINQDM